MKALTLYPEWAWAICRLGKDIENRTWAPPRALIGQRIAIHAGARIGGPDGIGAVADLVRMARLAGWSAQAEGGEPDDRPDMQAVRFTRGPQTHVFDVATCTTGHVVATATLSKVIDVDVRRAPRPWGAPHLVWWCLTDIMEVSVVPAKGRLGLWEFDGPIQPFDLGPEL